MRKLLALVLLAFFGLPFASALMALAPRSEARLPVCCRRAGQHHCGMTAAELDTPGGSRVAAPPVKCPFAPSQTVPGRNPELAAVAAGDAAFAGLVSHPASFAQVLAAARISQGRANGKRGPPVS